MPRLEKTQVPARTGPTRSSRPLLSGSKHLAATGSVADQHCGAARPPVVPCGGDLGVGVHVCGRALVRGCHHPKDCAERRSAAPARRRCAVARPLHPSSTGKAPGRHIGVNPQQPPTLWPDAEPRTGSFGAPARRPQPRATGCGPSGGPELSLWRSECEAGAPQFVEERHSRPPLLPRRLAGRRDWLVLVIVGLPLEQLGDLARVPGLDERLAQQPVGVRVAARAHRGNGAVEVVVGAPVLHVGAE